LQFIQFHALWGVAVPHVASFMRATEPAAVKAGVVFAGTLGGSWLLTMALRKIPVVARMI
jgi:hypothetical protein